MVLLFIRCHLTPHETNQICFQFNGNTWHPGSQVLWSGISREVAQTWAVEHNMQNINHGDGAAHGLESSVLSKISKLGKGWSKYVRGASNHICVAYIPKLPGYRSYCHHLQTNSTPLGEPRIRQSRNLSSKEFLVIAVLQELNAVHPTVKNAENFSYQLWPDVTRPSHGSRNIST